MRPQFYFLLVCLTCLNISAAQADLVVSWDLTGNNGAPAGQPANVTALHVTGLDITRSAGIGTHITNNTFATKGWENGPAASPAVDPDFISLGFTVDPGYEVDLDNFVLVTRSLAGGPSQLGLFYNGDNFSSAVFTFNQPATSEVIHDIDLSTLTGLAGTVEFRIIEIGNTRHDGTTATLSDGIFRLAETVSGDVRMNGTIMASVPEPSAFLCGGLISGVLGLNYYRKKRPAQRDSQASK